MKFGRLVPARSRALFVLQAVVLGSAACVGGIEGTATDDDEPLQWSEGGGQGQDDEGDRSTGDQAGAKGGGGSGQPADAGRGGSASGTEVDARPSPDEDDAGHSAPPETPPAGSVPMFVAAGHGGRTITSCDDGRTWIANHAYANANEDHSPYTHKGLAYGNGTFMVILAWGADVSLKISDDGVTWRRDTNVGRGSYGGIVFGGGVFAMVRNGQTQMSADLGKTWTKAVTQPGGESREGGGGGDAQRGVFALGGSGKVPWTSWDSGKNWRAAPGCGGMEFGSVGDSGGMAFGNGALVLIDHDGKTCRVTNNGANMMAGSLGERIRGKVFFTGGKFWVMNGNIAFRSDDGQTWQKLALSPTTVSIHSIAKGDSGTYVGVDQGGGRFYRSSDGVSWEAATGPAGTRLFRVVFGHGKPSANCPAP